MELTSLELEILSRIKPKDEEYRLVYGTYEKIAKAVKRALNEHSIEAEVTLQGSVAHDTWLSGSRDIDVFVLFPESWTKEDIKTRALPLLVEASRQVGEYTLMYAEHPYVRLVVNGVEADVVPAIKLREPSQIRTAVDRTPFHTEYIRKVLTTEQRDHVRLLKKFMKAIGVYGAEIKVHGFSGYAAELLVATYGSFRRVLEAASSTWRSPVFVETVPLTPKLKEALIKKYPKSCIYMPDPVDPERNVTASVSPRSLATFVIASRSYLRNPSLEFFQEPPELGVDEVLKALEDRCVVFLIYDLNSKLPPDAIWGEVQRIASRLYKLARILGISIVDYSAWTNEADTAVIAVEFDYCYLPRYKHYKGPCVAATEGEHANGFINEHRAGRVWISKDGCLEALAERTETRVVNVIESKWKEYTVSSHFKTVKPVVAKASREIIEELLQKGAGRWLRSFAVKTPHWMK